MNNIISVYKSKGPTSYDIIRALKKVLPRDEKIGHAGTLDPLASGVLVIAIGREATKKISEVVAKEKEYVATIRLGVTSTTDDEEGEKSEHSVARIPNREDVEKIARTFVGKIMQTPPIYSALKVGGKTAYSLARKGKSVELKARPVEIKHVEILSYEWPILAITAQTGPGVYIRALAREMGVELGVGGAYLADLERTRVGEFTKENSLTPEEAARQISNIQLLISK